MVGFCIVPKKLLRHVGAQIYWCPLIFDRDNVFKVFKQTKSANMDKKVILMHAQTLLLSVSQLRGDWGEPGNLGEISIFEPQSGQTNF